jgi:hypothetical protein
VDSSPFESAFRERRASRQAGPVKSQLARLTVKLTLGSVGATNPSRLSLERRTRTGALFSESLGSSKGWQNEGVGSAGGSNQ